MFKKFLLIILLALPLAGCGSSAPSSVSPSTETPSASVTQLSGFKVYENKDNDFRIQYPEGWELSENQPGLTAAFYAPATHDVDFRENVNVTVAQLGEAVNLKFEDIAQAVIAALKQQNTSFKIQSSGVATLGSLAGYQISYSIVSPGADQKRTALVTQTFTKKNDKIYSLNVGRLNADPKKFDDELKKMKDSFEFTN